MRNTTKLKAVLQHYNVDFSMDNNLDITITLYDKESGEFEYFESKTYASLIAQAFSFSNKQKRFIPEAPNKSKY